ncbi:MAG: glucose 1-dehydrogenase [Pseudomonadota bacterium]
MSQRLQEKVVLITGAAGGLGEAFARRADAEGARLVLTDMNVAGMEAYAGELAQEPLLFAHDVTDRAVWADVIEQTRHHFRGLDGLVHNAGIGTPRPFMELRDEDWRQMLAINLDSIFIGSQEAVPLMVATGGGSIVNVSSVAGIVSGPGMAAYSASKGGVRMLTKSMAVEFALGKVPVRVNSVHPAFTRTAMVQQLIDAAEDPERMEAKLARNSAQRRIAEPDEIAGILVHLLSDESTFTTGAEHIVDGGLTAM